MFFSASVLTPAVYALATSMGDPVFFITSPTNLGVLPALITSTVDNNLIDVSILKTSALPPAAVEHRVIYSEGIWSDERYCKSYRDEQLCE